MSMNEKTRKLIEDERAKHDGRYYEAGVWCALNWVLEEADEAAKNDKTDALSVVCKHKELILGDLQKAKDESKRNMEMIAWRPKHSKGIQESTICGRDSTKAQFCSGVLDGLERAIEILKEAGEWKTEMDTISCCASSRRA